MNPTQHPSNNSVLRPPPGMSIEQCRPLAITRFQYEDQTPALQSFWRPSDDEKKAIADGALVCLQIMGVTHPPLWVGVDGLAIEPTEPPVDRVVVAKQDLDELVSRAAERDRLQELVNTPELVNFREAVLREAAHQRERWGSEHDAGKQPSDWHWLVAHLAGRALFHAQELERLGRLEVKPTEVQDAIARHREKAVHHCITTAAAVANWHAAMLGLTNMRPGIAAPAEG